LPALTPSWITDLFLYELSNPANTDATVKEMLENVRVVLEKNGQANMLPGIDWAYKENRKWTNTRSTPARLDQRWSLASVDRVGREFNSAATRDLLDLSVICDTLGTSFTCRQAVWVTKLLSVVPIEYRLGTFARLEWLRSWSSVYAFEELRAESLGAKFFDSKDLDFLIVTDPQIFTHHVTQSGGQVMSPYNLTVKLREQSQQINTPAVWTAVMKSLYEPSAGSDVGAIGSSIAAQEFVWIPYMIGEAEISLKIDELNMSEWKAVAAILESTPQIIDDPLGTPSEDAAMELVRKVVDKVSNSQLEEAVSVAGIELKNRSQIYVQFTN